MTAPTKETHRYVGMWRPPFETISLMSDEACRCGQFLNKYYPTEKLIDHWLAGHFDEPIYEPLSEAKRSESSVVVESFRRMTPIDLSQRFPVDEGAAKGKVIQTDAIVSAPDQDLIFSSTPERIAPGHDIRDHAGELFGCVDGFLTDSSGKSSIVATRIRPMDACPVCFHRFEMGQPPHFKAEDSGTASDGERAVHWVRGTQTCPNCAATWPYEDSD